MIGEIAAYSPSWPRTAQGLSLDRDSMREERLPVFVMSHEMANAVDYVLYERKKASGLESFRARGSHQYKNIDIEVREPPVEG